MFRFRRRNLRKRVVIRVIRRRLKKNKRLRVRRLFRK
jgi:hypothetical protein